MKKYNAIFFDLDHTLWDFETNSKEAITEIFDDLKLFDLGIENAETFIDIYKRINTRMWADYQKNIINKEALRFGRFRQALQQFGIENEKLAEELSMRYLQICPLKQNLFPGTKEVLGKLQQKHSLHIITNGFKEVQYLKIKNSGLKDYFDHIHISEEIGYKKPEPEIFNYAQKTSGVSMNECIMIGDNLDTDIMGAKNVNLDHVFFNPEQLKISEPVMKEIHNLSELLIYFKI